MSTSTDATLLYGFCLEEEAELECLEDGEFEDYYASKLGIMRRDDILAYFKERDEAIEAGGCSIEWHCSYEYPMYAVAIRKSVTTAKRGYPEEITDLTVGDDWDEKLKAFCKVMDLPYQQPKWFIMSFWG